MGGSLINHSLATAEFEITYPHQPNMCVKIYIWPSRVRRRKEQKALNQAYFVKAAQTSLFLE